MTDEMKTDQETATTTPAPEPQTTQAPPSPTTTPAPEPQTTQAPEGNSELSKVMEMMAKMEAKLDAQSQVGNTQEAVEQVLYQKEIDSALADEGLKEMLSKPDGFGESTLDRLERLPLAQRKLQLQAIVQSHYVAQPSNPNAQYRTGPKQRIQTQKQKQLREDFENDTKDMIAKARSGELKPGQMFEKLNQRITSQ